MGILQIMKKTILAAVVAATLSISSVSFAGDIEKAERYSASLEQNVVEMDVSAVEMGQEIVALSELELGEKGLGSNAEIDELGWFAIWSGKHQCVFCWGAD
ncbi:hypothetical protein PN36_10880 [Candidatus Thiomargarita nelsonii]|uniref:Secreted protein n=1 Tax=Candidatus Thiomargarita nelsonii TaxID=1003181 RepID=A0A4E0RT18_9GAMM|nr:hypothetical protein PN36_10880 [Candidatus Thiomargarita nelsonii]